MKNSGILKEELLQGKYSQLLKEIYLDESMLEYQNNMQMQLQRKKSFTAKRK